MQTVAGLIDDALVNKGDENRLNEIKEKVKEFSLKFPVPGIE
jgi:glycine/serine hydroxymethyltransferase